MDVRFTADVVADGLMRVPAGTGTMEVEFVSHATIRDAVGEKSVTMDVPDSATLGEALSEFADAYPDVRSLLLDSDDDVRPNVNVLVDEENVRSGRGADTELSGGETVALAPGVAGGAPTNDGIRTDGTV